MFWMKRSLLIVLLLPLLVMKMGYFTRFLAKAKGLRLDHDVVFHCVWFCHLYSKEHEVLPSSFRV